MDHVPDLPATGGLQHVPETLQVDHPGERIVFALAEVSGQMQDAVHSGVLDAGHGVCAYWYGKHKAFSLFGTAPSFGWDSHGLLGWFYHGGGEALCLTGKIDRRALKAQYAR